MNSIRYTPAMLSILETLTMDPEKSMYTREIAEKARVSVGAASTILRVLEGSHLLDCEEKGGLKLYRINLSNPVAREFKILFNIRKVSDRIEEQKDLKEHADRIILFGSVAEGTDGPESDVDLFILTSEPRTVKDIIHVLQRRIDRSLSPIIVTAEGLARLRRQDKALFDQIYHGRTLWEKR